MGEGILIAIGETATAAFINRWLKRDALEVFGEQSLDVTATVGSDDDVVNRPPPVVLGPREAEQVTDGDSN
jgi:hypothetical protein